MTTPYAAAMSAYKDSALTTASPAHVVVLAYERLLLDCERAIACLEAGLPAHDHLIHAQDLILALQINLDVEVWDGAKRLSGLYGFIYQELISANISKNIPKIRSCLSLIGPLLDAWRHAESVYSTSHLNDANASTVGTTSVA